VVRREPEHSSLAAYLADNPRPPCPLVGLAWITEFRPAGPGRPHYHCSLPDCRNEQGTARQMMDHLIRRHHVSGWLETVVGVGGVAASQTELVRQCWELQAGLGRQEEVGVVVSQQLWLQCTKARLRLTRQQAEQLRLKHSKQSPRAQPECGQGPGSLVQQPIVEKVIPHTDGVTSDTTAPEERDIAECAQAAERISIGDPGDDRLVISDIELRPLEQNNVSDLPAEPTENVSNIEVQPTVDVVKEEPRIMKEENAVSRGSDLLAGTQELASIENNRKKKPARNFVDKVTQEVNWKLQRYYAKNKEDVKDKLIKIKNLKEFQDLCREFSHRFRKEIKETFVSFNGSEEGIDEVDATQYGIEHSIDRHFSDKPVCVPTFD